MEKYTCGLCQKFIEVLNEKLFDQAKSYKLIKDAHHSTASYTRWKVITKYEKEYVRQHIDIDYNLDIKQEEHKALKSVMAAATQHVEKFDHIK